MRGPESARAVLPPGRGRGSSVSSIVCYLTGLSHIDPVEKGLFSGRFLNEEIEGELTMPDIDLDFPRDIREVLIPRVHEVYGADRAALVAAFPTYRPRGAVRDLGKALALPPEEIERVAKMVGFHERAGEIERDVVAAIGERRAASPGWRALLELCGEAMGLPRHASQHPGGMVIATRPLIDVCPVVPAAMEGRQIVQWDKDSCSDAGFLKIDLLGLGMLSAVERCVDEVGRTRGERLDLSRIDSRTARPSTRSSGRRRPASSRSRAAPRCRCCPAPCRASLDDLTVQVALVRPGPIQGGAIHPYIERRKRLREDPDFEIPYDHPLLEPVLEETLGTIVYQEQVLEVAMALAGFSSAEAESLRRAMSRKRSQEAIERHHERFVDGAGEQRRRGGDAERVWEQIKGFSGFGFPKAHSAAFGLLAYQSAWLRVHRGPEFLCALLNEQPMGFYPPDSLVHEAQRRGVRVAAPDANRGGVLCQVEWRSASAAGWSCGSGSATSRGCARRRWRRWSAPASAAAPTAGSPTSPRARAPAATGSNGWPGRGRWTGSRPAGGRRAPRRRSGRWGSRRAGRRGAAGAPSWRCRWSRREPPALEPLGGLGGDDRRLPLDRDDPRRAPDGADARRARPGAAAQHRPRRGSRTAARSRWPGWWSPASAPRPPRGSSSCCSRTSAAPST